MTRRSFINLATVVLGLLKPGISLAHKKKKISIRLLRHATLVIEWDGIKFLVDPMLSPKDAMDPVKNVSNEVRIPMVDLPITLSEIDSIINTADAVMITHTHRDHWDTVAQNRIPKNKMLLVQPSDVESIGKQGFENVTPVDASVDFKGLKILRTGGQHGTGEIGLRMGKVSGFIVSNGKTKIYVAGDTVWCVEVERAIKEHRPDVIILNAGEARFSQGDPITMGVNDIVKVCLTTPKSKIIAVHMDTINHCLLTRSELKKALAEKGMSNRLNIPNDGETIEL